jgi:hypothetical protein
MDALDRTAPLARREGLVVQELSDEVLVYDLDRHRAHSLNPTAAWLWRHCDGTMSVEEMAAGWHEELHLPQDEELVWLALDRLARTHLLEGGLARPVTVPNPSRRALMRNLATAGGLALVTSIIAPNAYASAVSFPPCQAGGACSNGHCCVCNSTGLPGNCVGNCGSVSNAGSCANLCQNQGGVKCCNASTGGMVGFCSS